MTRRSTPSWRSWAACTRRMNTWRPRCAPEKTWCPRTNTSCAGTTTSSRRSPKSTARALRCTAAVGGGIPWLTNLEKAARANHISRVWGILNGTTNYIMDAMHGSDVDFADVLAQAQALGYAEADPSADIDGWTFSAS